MFQDKYWINLPSVRYGVVVDVTTLKMVMMPVKLQKENLAGCAGEGKQSKGKQERRKYGLKITDNSIM